MQSVVYTGSGCTAETVQTEVINEGTQLRLHIPPNTVSLGRRTCNITIPVSVPASCQVALMPLRLK
ncbi:MAG: hypothetical protein CR991_00575 [Proteobacteria bacterium]|nr:MAG: hypothetical protein CR991_00575 [Pseudomonadota bacterium]